MYSYNAEAGYHNGYLGGDDDKGLTGKKLTGTGAGTGAGTNARVVSVSKDCWRLRCSKVVMACPTEGGNGIPVPKCIPSGKGKFKMSWWLK